MAKNHGARQQKKVAKQKAKRSEKRSELLRRSSTDPTVRLRQAESWPVVQALIGTDLWKTGIGQLVLARKESEGSYVFGVYLVDVYCLGVKNAFWKAGSPGLLSDLLRRFEENEPLSPISPAGLVKVVKGAVEYAASLGFRPHPDFRNAAMLFHGIDPETCPQEFTFGNKGKPLYIQGPHESPEQARAIMERLTGAGGNFVIQIPGPGPEEFFEDEDEDEVEDEDEPDQPALPAP